MRKIKCENCGSPMDQDAKCCPHCGIRYVDMTHINLDSMIPFVLKLKLQTSQGSAILTQIAAPKLNDTSIHLEDEGYQCISNVDDLVYYQFQKPKVLHTNLSFISTYRPEQPIFTLQIMGDEENECH